MLIRPVPDDDHPRPQRLPPRCLLAAIKRREPGTMMGAGTPAIDPRLLSILRCPRCHHKLKLANQQLFCELRHEYPIVDGVPVFILAEKQQTIGIAAASYDAAKSGVGAPLYVATLGLSEDERASVETRWAKNGGVDHIDPAISYLIGATCGLGYVNLIGRAPTYPIPQIPVGEGRGELLLDIGCNWGRWSISAARKGWSVVGIDPSLGAIMAARRAFNNEHDIMFVCGDARFLPFKDNVFRCIFSYSVLQHFSEIDADLTLGEIGRVLHQNGYSKVQMAHRGGLRSTYARTRRSYADGQIFRVRYWSLVQMKQIFTDRIGRSSLIPEAFGGLGLLLDDWRLVSAKAKILIILSVSIKKVAHFLKPLVYLADSIYVVSTKR